jgi:hypothetical protein
MYRKFDVTGNLLFAQYFFEEVNTAYVFFRPGAKPMQATFY